MNNEMILNARELKTREVIASLAALLASPLKWLNAYYGHVLGRAISTRQTLSLLHVQVAFLFTVLPSDCHLMLRLACAAWLLLALRHCREELG